METRWKKKDKRNGRAQSDTAGIATATMEKNEGYATARPAAE